MSLNRAPLFLIGSAGLSALATGFLVAGLVNRADGSTGTLFRMHDLAACLAAISIAAAAWSLKDAAVRHGSSVGSSIAFTGTSSAIATALCLFLILSVRASDMLYMLPQGGVGLWLVALGVKWPTAIGRATRIFGIGVGVGLVLIAVAFIAIAIAAAQGPELWVLSNQQLSDPDPAIESSSLNVVGHQVLAAGTLLGVLAYPVWAVIASRAFSRQRA